ncbi:hypothetical protein BpHYR1_026345 [Brachionus plicatilis]|uniref:Uncharacterized protein n=1 Tax=Brachionus plicatilis TaxID=10195 RepID=A0A3M7PRZ4_BRAPC|nr:hypothetical protein BpHYR1_026345 [Brachionus plicatilis]
MLSIKNTDLFLWFYQNLREFRIFLRKFSEKKLKKKEKFKSNTYVLHTKRFYKNLDEIFQRYLSDLFLCQI